MKTSFWFRSIALSSCAALVLCGGCDKKAATETLKNAEESAQEAASNVASGVGDAVDEGKAAASDAVESGKQMASDLGEKAMAFLTPLKEEFGDLDSLKEKPEELKVAVTDLIQKIEDKSADIKLPEAVSTALASVKEKLIALKDYLEGEVEQAKIEEHLKDIMDSVKSGLGMTEK